MPSEYKMEPEKFLKYIRAYRIHLAPHQPPGGFLYWKAWLDDDPRFEADTEPDFAVARLIKQRGLHEPA